MKNKMFKISISYDSGSDEPVHVRLTDNATGHKEEVRGSLDSIKKRVIQALERWRQDGSGALAPEVCEYYATYVDYEARLRAAESSEG